MDELCLGWRRTDGRSDCECFARAFGIRSKGAGAAVAAALWLHSAARAGRCRRPPAGAAVRARSLLASPPLTQAVSRRRSSAAATRLHRPRPASVYVRASRSASTSGRQRVRDRERRRRGDVSQHGAEHAAARRHRRRRHRRRSRLARAACSEGQFGVWRAVWVCLCVPPLPPPKTKQKHKQLWQMNRLLIGTMETDAFIRFNAKLAFLARNLLCVLKSENNDFSEHKFWKSFLCKSSKFFKSSFCWFHFLLNIFELHRLSTGLI